MNQPTMPAEHNPDPGAEAAARAAQLAAMLVSVAEAAARLRAHRLTTAHAAAEHDATARRALAAARAADARLVYGAALDNAWLRQASTSELLDSWAAADGYLTRDPLARLASERVEHRLRSLHPEAMTAHDAARAAGRTRDECLAAAAPWWRGEYGLDPVGTPVARQPPTGHPPDPTPAAPPRRDVRPDTATGTVRQAFPVAIEQAMATAPHAARQRLALVAAPQRRQLTATPHVPRSSR